MLNHTHGFACNIITGPLFYLAAMQRAITHGTRCLCFSPYRSWPSDRERRSKTALILLIHRQRPCRTVEKHCPPSLAPAGPVVLCVLLSLDSIKCPMDIQWTLSTYSLPPMGLRHAPFSPLLPARAISCTQPPCSRAESRAWSDFHIIFCLTLLLIDTRITYGLGTTATDQRRAVRRISQP